MNLGTKLQDDILSAIVEYTNYPLFGIGQAYKRLRPSEEINYVKL